MRKLLALTTVVAALLGCGGGSSDAQATTPPNVIVVMMDDLGYGDLSSYGQTHYKTRFLDQMATRGVKFTHAYSTGPWCFTARHGLMTGQDSGEAPYKGSGFVYHDYYQSLGKLAHSYGYTTGMFGKWGMVTFDENGTAIDGFPQNAGFDRFVGHLTHRDAHYHYLDSPATPEQSTPEHPYVADVRQKLWQVNYDGKLSEYGNLPWVHVNSYFVKSAKEFIFQNREKPFFIYLPLSLPHAELAAPKQYVDRFRDAQGNSVFPETPFYGDKNYRRHVLQPRATYAGMIEFMDDLMKELVEYVEAQGLAQNTLIIFTSDNGPHSAGGIQSPEFFNSAGGLTNAKFTLYEGGIRVPAIAYWPGRLTPKVVDTPVALWDIGRTFEAYAGNREVENSWKPVLERGDAAASEVRDTLYWEFYYNHAQGQTIPATTQAVRRGDWKLLRLRIGPDPDKQLRLYNTKWSVVEDESTNLIRDPRYCHIAQELQQVMMTQHTPAEESEKPFMGWEFNEMRPLKCE